MRISYDPKADALYMRLMEKPLEVTTQRLTEDVAVGYSPDGRVVGIEVLGAAKYIGKDEAAPHLILDSLTPVPAEHLATECTTGADAWERLGRLGDEIAHEWSSPMSSTELLTRMRG